MADLGTVVSAQTRVTAEWVQDVNDLAYQYLGYTADGGANGMWPDVTAATKILRARDRLFVGGGAAFTGNRIGTQGGFAATSAEGANWAPRDARMFVASDEGLIQVAGFVSNANIDATSGEPTESIGVAGFAIGNKASRSVWGLYGDVQFEAGNYGYGLELAIKNKGSDLTSTPYFPTTGTYGLWLAGGGDSSYGDAATAPSNTAIAIGRTSGAPYGWNKGLIFFHDGLTRSGSDYATAIEMAEKHRVIWRTELNTVGFDVRSEVSAASSEVAIIAGNNSVSVAGTGGALIGQFAHQASAVNYWQVLNSATGSALQLVAAGTDTDIDLRFTPKGAGAVRFGTHTSSSDTAVSGYITIKDAGGTERKLAVIT